MRTTPSNSLFISYSHLDSQWLNRFKTMLAPLEREAGMSIWDDTLLVPGSLWEKEIISELSSSRIALLLVSPHFLASPFIANAELPRILSAVENNSLTICWALLSSCLYEQTAINGFKAAHDISVPLDLLSPAKRNKEIAGICREMKKILQPN